MKNKTLIVVDMQEGFMENAHYREVSKKINSLLATSKYDAIFVTRFINKHHSLYERRLNWTNLQDERSGKFSIDVPQNAIVLEKYGYGLEIKQLKKLKRMKLDEVDICGVQTDACVYAIALQLFDNGIFPNILINYVSTDSSREVFAKEMLIHQFGSVDERE